MNDRMMIDGRIVAINFPFDCSTGEQLLENQFLLKWWKKEISEKLDHLFRMEIQAIPTKWQKVVAIFDFS